MLEKEVANTASQCRQYAMCKIDFLGSGLCPAGAANHFVSYYPQGRMRIVQLLAESRIPVTERLIDIAKTCTLCGSCDKQCYFITELRPMKVMKALKDTVNTHVRAGKEILRPRSDPVLDRLRQVVGDRWATNDPAILACYAQDPDTFSEIQTPNYVVLPLNREEVSSIVRICREHGVPYAVRGNGSTGSFDFVSPGRIFAKRGLVIDMARMKGIALNKASWYVSVEPGVSGFELQKEVAKHGLRVNVAEPAALVCANLMDTGIISTFSASYGTCASNYINAEFVGADGKIFHLNQRDAPNLFAFQKEEMALPGICTRADVKVYVKEADEEAILVPFSNFHDALVFARELGRRRIGLSVSLLNPEYMTSFMAPTSALGTNIKNIFREDLGVHYAVLIIGDRYDLQAVRSMAAVVIDSDLMKTLVLGMPNMVEDEWKDLAQGLEGGRPPYETILRPEMRTLIKTILSPSSDLFAEAFPEDLREFFTALYARPEMTDMIWLTMFRIISSRIGRGKHFAPFLVYVPLDDVDMVANILSEFKQIAETYGVTHASGFLTPLDFGKSAAFEYDYYVNPRKPSDLRNLQDAVNEAFSMFERLKQADRRIKWAPDLVNQGFSRMENILYL
jgi:hypothetical protein